MNNRLQILCAALFMLALLSVAVKDVYAQTLPGSADSSRFDDRFKLPPLESGNDIRLPEDSMIDDVIPEAQDGFFLTAVDLQGVTVFSQEDFVSLIDQYTGREADLGVLNHLAARITAYYRTRGYFLSKAIIPAQDVRNGRVTIQVIEGYVYDVVLEDPDNLLGSDFLGVTADVIAKIKTLVPLHGPSLERYVLLLNEGASVIVQSVMSSAGQVEKIGGIIITLKILKKPGNAFLTYNNHGSKFVGPHQADLAYVTGGIFSPYDNLSVQATASIPVREVQYGSVIYSLPLTAEGLRFNTSVSYANSEPGYILKILEVESDSFLWESGFVYPFIRSRRTNLNIGAAFNVKNSATEFLDEELIDDKIRSVIFTADYNTQNDDGSLNSVFVSLHKGLDIFEATETGSSNLSRTQGRSDFVKITASAARVQQLSSDFNIVTQMEGQYAPHPLLSSAEFGYGGAELGRAYDASELTGDIGVSGGLELRYNSLGAIEHTISLTPFAFYDIGKVWNEDRGSKPISAASAGFGTYYQIAQPVSGSLMVAWPLTKSVSTPIMGGTDGPRVLFELNARF